MPFPLSEIELQKTENIIGATFPESYRKYMMKNNGGEIETREEEWTLFPIFDQSSNKLKSRTCNHVLKETESAKQWRTYHENAYSIASNGCGDLLVMFQKGKVFETEIFIWRHEDGALELVAKDFNELKITGITSH